MDEAKELNKYASRQQLTIEHLSRGIISHNYQYKMACVIRKKHSITNNQQATEQHSSKNHGNYVFTNIQSDNMKITKDGLNFKTGTLIISSITPVVEDILEGFQINPFFNIDKEKFVVTKSEKLKIENIKSPCTLTTRSPMSITVKKEQEDGEDITWTLYPDNPRFSEQLSKNIINRYSYFCNTLPVDPHFIISNVREIKNKAIKIGTNERISYRRCSYVTFDVDASNELLNFVCLMGAGELPVLGFGYMVVI